MVVWGTLVVENRPAALVTLRTTCITVQPGGALLAGEPASPFAGTLQILMSGDEMTESHQCGGWTGRRIYVHRTARLSLHGKRPATLWSKLAATARAGDYTISVQVRILC